MKLKTAWMVAAVAALTIGCNSEESGDGSTGSARVSALSAADVDRVDILIDGVVEATLTGGATSITISDIPVGTYTFSANAYDEGTLPDPSDDVLIYQGSAPGVAITEGVPVSVNIVLQQLIDIPDPFANDVPIFQSLVYSPASPVVDEDVTLTVVVTDADGDPLTIAWTAASGTVVPDDQLSVVWTTPSTPNTTPGYALTVTANDGSATASLTVEIPVDFVRGDTNVTIKLNNFPLVSDLVPVPTRIDVVPGDDTTSLTLTASDPDGDDLEYAWSASGCAGTFSDATATPDFTLTDAQGGTECTLSVTVTDVDALGNPYGGSNTADVTIATGPAVAAVGVTELSCTFSTSASTIVNYHVPTPFVAAIEVVPFEGAVNISCEDTGGPWSCSAEFANVMGPYALAGLGELCIYPMPADFCARGSLSCDPGTNQTVTLEQRHNIGNESIAGRPPPPRSCATNAECRGDCDAYCAAKGAVRVANSPACEGFCRESDIPMCLPDSLTPADDPTRNECPAGDTCDELESYYGHDGYCGCQCVTVGDGSPTGAGEAVLNIGYSYTLLLDSSNYGPDTIPCTPDDEPGVTAPSVCFPYTTSTATITLPDAGYSPTGGGAILIDGAINPPPTSGVPFTCVDGAPVTTAGVRLQGVFASKDTARWDEATEVTINCE